ncbi:MAG TPA: hypothetical protein VK875_03475 [Euzebyales bacterium]|nr:hypothetical protein [Euzebyales bacterium]
MFSFTCPRHGAEVMIWTSDIDGIRNTADGIEVHFHCSCGFRGVLRTGAGRRERVLAAAA